MINLTQAQQNIVKSDSTVKNFRVHFPNGENTDLTNGDIVFETVKFSESVCSEESFRFGCAESSVIEFETVGVQNIIGMVIECSMEFVGISETVIVPYGTFVVDSCPRDHHHMTHRKVTAYSRRITNELLTDFEILKTSLFVTDGDGYVPNLKLLLAETFGTSEVSTDSEFCSLSNYRGTSQNSFQFVIGRRSNDQYELMVNITTASSAYFNEALYSMSASYDSAYIDAIDRILGSYTFDETYPVAIYQARHLAGFLFSYANSRNNYPPYQIGLESFDHIYPYFNAGGNGSFTYPLNISARLYKVFTDGSSMLEDLGTFTPYTALTITQHLYDLSGMNLRIVFPHTLENRWVSTTVYSYYNSFSIYDLICGWAELNGAFLRAGRDGSYYLSHLDNSAPYGLTADDVDGSAWWDEYVIRPIGTIVYTYEDDGQQTSKYVLSDTPSTYDMSGNYLLDNLSFVIESAASIAAMTDTAKIYTYSGNWYYYDGSAWVNAGTFSGMTSIIEKILDQYFVPYVGTVDFVPLDANLRGLPFLEAGDAITLTAGDGTVINSYILAHTFDGIQYIREDIQTVQGTVIGSEVEY